MRVVLDELGQLLLEPSDDTDFADPPVEALALTIGGEQGCEHLLDVLVVPHVDVAHLGQAPRLELAGHIGDQLSEQAVHTESVVLVDPGDELERHAVGVHLL